MNAEVNSNEEETLEVKADLDNEHSDDDVIHHELEEDVFVIGFVSPILSRPFLYATLIFLLQISILIFFLINQLANSDSSNFFDAPVKAEIVLILSQVLALVVTVMTADDIITSLDVFVIRYDSDIEKEFPHASKIKWYITNLLRMTVGAASVMTALVFIIQSDQVLDLFLNFAAVQFVSEIDNIGFKLANHGYSMFDLMELTNDIKRKLKVKVSTTIKKNVQHKQKVCLLFLFVVIGILWLYVRILQYRNFYYLSECQKFEVRFDNFEFDFFNDYCDENSTVCLDEWKGKYESSIHYTSFNGFYEVHRSDTGKILTFNGRPQYYQNGLSEMDAYGDNSPAGKIFYCANINSWVFGIEKVNKGIVAENSRNDCNWLMRSPPTSEYLLQHVSTENWYVWTGSLEISTDLVISCTECMQGVDIDKSDSSCSYHGKCIEKECSCHSGWMGSQCETCSACVNVNMTIVKGESNSTWQVAQMPKSENDNEPLNVYDRPAYFRSDGEGSHVLVYSGLRYIILKLQQDAISDTESYREFLKTFHSTWDRDSSTSLLYQSSITTEPMPFDLEWEDPNTEIKVKVLLDCPSEQKKMCPSAFNR